MCSKSSFGLRALFFLCFFKAFFIICQSLFLQYLTCQIHRESISIIKLECILSGKYGCTFCFHICFHVSKNRQSLIDRLVKLRFFFCNDIENKVFFLFQFRISILGTIDNSLCQFYEECSLNAKQSSMTAGTTQQTPQHITSSTVGRHNSVRDHKRDRTDMIRDNTERNICLIACSIRYTCNAAYMVAQCFHCIDIKHRIYILHNTCKTLQSHTGINILLFKFCVVVVSVIVKLCKYVIPDFHVPITFTSYCTIRTSATIFLTAVVIYF